jgi:excisionase family DNA binding protein
LRFRKARPLPDLQEKERSMNPMAVDDEILTVGEVLTVKEVSEMLRVQPTTVYRLIRQGKIPSFQIGTDWRFLKHRLVRWMAEQSMSASQ